MKTMFSEAGSIKRRRKRAEKCDFSAPKDGGRIRNPRGRKPGMRGNKKARRCLTSGLFTEGVGFEPT